MKRVSDQTLSDMRLDLEESSRGLVGQLMSRDEGLSLVLEVEERRAAERAADAAAERGERLDDLVLRNIVNGMSDDDSIAIKTLVALAAECLRHRASALDADDIHRLTVLRGYIKRNHPRWVDDLALLDKILRAHGIATSESGNQ